MTAPGFGQRGLKGPPIKGPPLGRPPEPPRRMRSHYVWIGGVGILALLLLTSRHRVECDPPKDGAPDQRPQSCFDQAYSSGGGHGVYSGGGGGGGSAHATFGGFGGAGAGHGGGE